MSPIHLIARAVIIDHGHLCVCFNPQSPSYVYLPGGHVEENESAEESVIREIKEETGETLKNIKFLGTLEHIFHRPHSCHSHEINLIFQGDLTRSRYPHMPTSLEPDTVAFRWADLKDLSSHRLLPDILTTLIPTWIQDPGSTPFYSAIHDRR